jgi:hypothetical protein
MISSVPMRNFMTLFVLMEEHNVSKAGKRLFEKKIIMFLLKTNCQSET